MEEAEAILAHEQLADEANYRARGRRFRRLTDQELIELWIAYLRREFIELAEHRADGRDLSAEISIRGLGFVDLPHDLREAMRAEAVRLCGKYTLAPMN